MKIGKEEFTIIPLLRESKAAHLLIQSGLVSAPADVTNLNFIETFKRVERPIFSSDILNLDLMDILIESVQHNSVKPSLLLSFYDLSFFTESVEKAIAANIPIYIIKAKPLLESEETKFRKLWAEGVQIRLVFTETKENNLYAFLTSIPEYLRKYVMICYLPKVTDWDVLLSPLEVSERLDKNKDFLALYGINIFVLANDELRNSLLKRSFYLSPGKEEYRKIFKENFRNNFLFYIFSADSFYRFLVGFGDSLKNISNFSRQLLHPREKLNELRISIYNIIKYRLAHGVQNFFIKAYWRAYPLKGFAKQMGIFLYWKLRRTTQASLVLVNIAGIKLYWNAKSLFLTSKVVIHTLKAGYWTLHQSWVMRPFLKVYWFFEYQYLTRVLRKKKDEH